MPPSTPISTPPTSSSAAWALVIRPGTGWFDWRLHELWQHRDLFWLLVWRDFVTVHKQTILGPLWHVVNPILTSLIYTLIFGRVVKLPTDGLPPILFYMCGTVAWNYFSACFIKTNNSLAGNAGLFGKVYFHRLVVPLSVIVSCFISFAIQCGILATTVTLFGLRGASIHPNVWLLAIPLLVFMLAGYGLAFGLICSAVTTRYRDLGQVIGFFTQLLMYATPIIYPVSVVGEKYRWLIHANPFASIIETFRYAILGKGTPEPFYLTTSALLLLVLLTLGITLYLRKARTFVDTV